MVEIDTVLGQVVPAVEAAVGAYGVGVLTRAEDEAAGATVRLGQRLLARILHRGTDTASIEAAVTDLAESSEDPDVLNALRWQIKKVLRDDPQFAEELSATLPERPAVQASGKGSVAVGRDNNGIISTGEGARNILHR
ncbi:hypothetical protein GCM10010211_46360 [Streptomyces albospinus]|uniref:Uncharacterized protein n=1 Tax=Streptomyces albospinus TaxID=285515 RepID=A0ABQ2V9V4_9ACTN|nr:hypothetical protein [Streptomyces albospinus]GGU75109.1 hypothetical protein GCM10010211_46360 [Streptomyces albospinus]